MQAGGTLGVDGGVDESLVFLFGPHFVHDRLDVVPDVPIRQQSFLRRRVGHRLRLVSCKYQALSLQCLLLEPCWLFRFAYRRVGSDSIIPMERCAMAVSLLVENHWLTLKRKHDFVLGRV